MWAFANEIMCCFDVCSLFTNVPLDETIQIFLMKLYSLPDPPGLPRPVLKNLLVFATKKGHFIFDGQYYGQIDGVAMGSPLGPVLANIFMCHFEEKWFLMVCLGHPFGLDMLMTLSPYLTAKTLLLGFYIIPTADIPISNSQWNSRKTKRYQFLDVRIKRNHSTFSTWVHRKQTFTNKSEVWFPLKNSLLHRIENTTNYLTTSVYKFATLSKFFAAHSRVFSAPLSPWQKQETNLNLHEVASHLWCLDSSNYSTSLLVHHTKNTLVLSHEYSLFFLPIFHTIFNA